MRDGLALLAMLVLAAGCTESPPARSVLRVIIRSDQGLPFAIVASDGRRAGQAGEAMTIDEAAAQIRDRFVFDAEAKRRFTVNLADERKHAFVHPEFGMLRFIRRLPHPDRPGTDYETAVDAILVTAQAVPVRNEVVYTVRLAPPPLPPDAAKGGRP